MRNTKVEGRGITHHVAVKYKTDFALSRPNADNSSMPSKTFTDIDRIATPAVVRRRLARDEAFPIELAKIDATMVFAMLRAFFGSVFRSGGDGQAFKSYAVKVFA